MMALDEAAIPDDSLPLRALVGAERVEPDGYVRLEVDEATWISLAKANARGLHDLSALWFDDGRMRMALSDPASRRRAIVSIATRGGSYPAVARYHAPAARLERAMRDLYGTDPLGLADSRPWLDHGTWPPHNEGQSKPAKPYAFLPAEGEGLHQIPVGPIHAGIIEPGHFRFTANGETIVRLEERLGYVHKGIEVLCAGASIDRAARIAARISGDSTVAYSFAFANAVETVLDWRPPKRALLLRGIMAELERLSHHVNDVGAICNDASVIAVYAQCMLIREDILRIAST